MNGNENLIPRMTGTLNIALGFTGLVLAALGGLALVYCSRQIKRKKVLV
jgi:hypothetical protein